MKVRPMRESDAAVVAELATELGYPPSTGEAIRERIEMIGGSDLLLVAADFDDGVVDSFRRIAFA